MPRHTDSSCTHEGLCGPVLPPPGDGQRLPLLDAPQDAAERLDLNLVPLAQPVSSRRLCRAALHASGSHLQDTGLPAASPCMPATGPLICSHAGGRCGSAASQAVALQHRPPQPHLDRRSRPSHPPRRMRCVSVASSSMVPGEPLRALPPDSSLPAGPSSSSARRPGRGCTDTVRCAALLLACRGHALSLSRAAWLQQAYASGKASHATVGAPRGAPTFRGLGRCGGTYSTLRGAPHEALLQLVLLVIVAVLPVLLVLLFLLKLLLLLAFTVAVVSRLLRSRAEGWAAYRCTETCCKHR